MFLPWPGTNHCLPQAGGWKGALRRPEYVSGERVPKIVPIHVHFVFTTQKYHHFFRLSSNFSGFLLGDCQLLALLFINKAIFLLLTSLTVFARIGENFPNVLFLEVIF